MITFKQILLLVGTISFISSCAIAKAGMSPAGFAGAGEFKHKDQLETAIEKESLHTCIPEEFSSCSKSHSKEMWREFLVGLAHIESTWRPDHVNEDDANGLPSVGYFQMTGTDKARGKSCFPGAGGHDKVQTKDPEKNINCGVAKMAEYICDKGNKSGSIMKLAHEYWGPFKAGNPNHHKAKALIEDVKGHCGTSKFTPAIFDGLKKEGGSSKGTPSAT